MRVALFVLLAACESGDVLPALAPPQADVEVWLVQAKVPSGEPAMVTVQTTAAEGWSFQPIVPYADDLEVSLVAESGPATVNDRQVVSRQYAMSGPDGSYVISTTEGEATGPGGQSRTFESVPLFADIGVDGPTGGPMDGFATAPQPEPKPWREMILAALAAAILLSLILWWRHRRAQRATVAPPPVPPHILAQGAWADARATIKDEHAQAVRLSMVLREYLEARTGIPASKATTSEIWEALSRSGVDGRPINDALKGHIAQILDATDRLKFARVGGGAEFFQALDAHFGVIMRVTRPVISDEAPDA